MTPLARYVVDTLVTLMAVATLAVLLLTVLRRVGVGKPGGPLELVARLPLDGRRAVYLVRVGETVYVLGGSEHALQKLGELPPGAVTQIAESPAPSFAQVLRGALGMRSQSPSPGPALASERKASAANATTAGSATEEPRS